METTFVNEEAKSYEGFLKHICECNDAFKDASNIAERNLDSSFRQLIPVEFEGLTHNTVSQYFARTFNQMMGAKINNIDVYAVNDNYLKYRKNEVVKYTAENPNATIDEIVKAVAYKNRRYSWNARDYVDIPTKSCSYYYVDKTAMGVAWFGGKVRKSKSAIEPNNDKQIFTNLNEAFPPLITDKRKSECLQNMIEIRNALVNSFRKNEDGKVKHNKVKINIDVINSTSITVGHENFNMIKERSHVIVDEVNLVPYNVNLPIWDRVDYHDFENPTAMSTELGVLEFTFHNPDSSHKESRTFARFNHFSAEPLLYPNSYKKAENTIFMDIMPIVDVVKPLVCDIYAPVISFVSDIKTLKEKYADLLFFSLE